MTTNEKYMNKLIANLPTVQSGIYAILNPVEKKVYVGESGSVSSRIKDHIENIISHRYNNCLNGNKNLIKEKHKTFEIVILKREDYNDMQSRILDETIYMYLFRLLGFSLYNEPNDNRGYERLFLLNDLPELQKGMEEYLCNNNKKEIFWGLQKEKRHLDNQIKEQFGFSASELCCMEKSERLEKWGKRVDLIQSKVVTECLYGKIEEYTTVIDLNSNVNKTIEELFAQKKLSKTQMKSWGLTEKSIVEIVQNGDADRIFITKIGEYGNQDLETILKTKIYDLKNNIMGTDVSDIHPKSSKEGEGICFWALQKTEATKNRKFLCGQNMDDKEKSYYAIMLLGTGLKNNWEKDTITLEKNDDYKAYFIQKNKEKEEFINDQKRDDFFPIKGFVTRFEKNRKKAESKLAIPYPEEMYPEEIKIHPNEKYETRSQALLISELSYASENFSEEEFGKFFNCFLVTSGEWKEYSKVGQTSTKRASILDKEEFLKKFRYQSGEKTDLAGCLIAKLKYPYIVEVDWRAED